MNTEDLELLELAAKAYVPESFRGNENYLRGLLETWNPLKDDGDALRLAVKMAYIDVSRHILSAWQENDTDEGRREYVRRAIVRAAAEIGRRMA